MVRMRPVSMILASASLAVLLSACGSDIHPGDQTAQAPSASSGNAGNNNVAPNASGYWQLAGRIFQRSGQSEQSTVDVNDHVESTLEIHGRIPPATPVNGAAASASTSTTSGTPVATETFRLDTEPIIGMETSASHCSLTRRRSPLSSAPITMATGPAKSVRYRSASASSARP